MAAATNKPAGAQIQQAGAADIARIAGALAGAFFDDPVFRWAVPDDTRRRAALPGIFSVFTEAFLPYGETYRAGQVVGAALWAPPGKPAPDDEDEELNRRFEELAGADAERFFEISALIEEHHPQGSYYYLQFMGVRPDQQGYGIGSALLAHMLERCDREGVRAYLDATSPSNKRLYERHGFRASGEFGLVGAPPLWPMWREPGG